MPRPGVAPPVIVVRRPGPPRLRPHGSIVREIELSEEDLEQLDDNDLWRWYQYQGQRRRNRCRTNNFGTMIASTRSSTDAGTAASTNSGIINASTETITADAGTGTAASTNSGTINASSDISIDHSFENLVDDGLGGYRCALGKQCKTAGVAEPIRCDWHCSMCGDLVFAKNNACRQCGCTVGVDANAMRGKGGMGKCVGKSRGKMMAMLMMGGGMMGGGMKGWFGKSGTGVKGVLPGDWNCRACNEHNFHRNTECRKCGSTDKISSEGEVHGKKRSPNTLEEDGTGGWKCSAGFGCTTKTGGIVNKKRKPRPSPTLAPSRKRLEPFLPCWPYTGGASRDQKQFKLAA